MGRMNKKIIINKHRVDVNHLQAISGLWPGVIFCPTVVQTDGSSEWGGLDDGHPCVGNGVWCADRNLTRNLVMVVGMVGKHCGCAG